MQLTTAVIYAAKNFLKLKQMIRLKNKINCHLQDNLDMTIHVTLYMKNY